MELIEQRSLESKPEIIFLKKYGVALAPALSYIYSYRFEQSYCNAYQIPVDFIQVDINTILYLTSILLTLGYCCWLMSDSLNGLSKTLREENDTERIIRLYAPSVITLFLITAVIGQTLIYWAILFFAVMLFVISIDIFMAKKHSPDVSFIRRLKGPKFYYGRMRKSLIVTGLFFFSYWFTGIMGAASAKNKNSFLVPSINTESVVVRSYGEKIICYEVNMANNKIKDRFFVINKGDDPQLFFERKKIGRLIFK